MTRVLVTGGAGFIGSTFVRHVLRRRLQWSVTVLDKLTYAGSLENLRGLDTNSRLRFVHGDIADRETVDELFEDRFDLILNFAAETHVDRSIEGVEPFLRSDVRGVYALLEAALRRPPRRFIHISTDEVYGSAEHGAFDENSPLRPSSPYAACKAAADCLVRAYGITYGVPVIITRASNNYGPRQHPEKLIPRFTTQALRGLPLPLYGDGGNVRDWIHVRDHCRALLRVAERGEVGGVYNIGANEERSNRQIAEAILAELALPRTLIQRVPDRPGHDRRYALDASKLRALGWRPRIPFAAGLRATIAWYRGHRSWWRVARRRSGWLDERAPRARRGAGRARLTARVAAPPPDARAPSVDPE